MKRSDLHQRVTGGETLGDELRLAVHSPSLKSTAIASNAFGPLKSKTPYATIFLSFLFPEIKTAT